MTTPRTYTAAEVAEMLGIGHSTLCRHVRDGNAQHLHPIRVGTTIRFPRTHIDQLLKEAA